MVLKGGKVLSGKGKGHSGAAPLPIHPGFAQVGTAPREQVSRASIQRQEGPTLAIRHAVSLLEATAWFLRWSLHSSNDSMSLAADSSENGMARLFELSSPECANFRRMPRPVRGSRRACIGVASALSHAEELPPYR